MSTRLLVVLLLCAACTPVSPVREQTDVARQGLLSAAYSPDGKQLFTGAFHDGGALWDSSSNARLYNWNQQQNDYSAYISADFSEDGRFVATSDGTAITIWNTSTGAPTWYLQSPAQSLGITNTQDIWSTSDASASDYWQKPARIIDMAFSQQYLLLAVENQVALLVDITRRSVIGSLPHLDSVSAVAMNDSARLALTGALSGEATLWDLDSGEALFEMKESSAIAFVALSASGALGVIAVSQGPVYLLDRNRQTRRLFETNPGITAIKFNNTETELLVGTARETVTQYDLVNFRRTKTWTLPKQGWHRTAAIDVAYGSKGIQVVTSDGVAYLL